MPGRWLAPGRYLTSVLQIEVEWLRSRGFKALLLDIDNTLVSRDTQEVSPVVIDWVNELTNQGFKLYLVTNNWHRVVFETAALLSLPVVHRSMKPLPFNYLRALSRLKVKRRNALVVGDQLMTDILGAKLSGIESVLVLPLTDTDLMHTKILRKVEKVLLGDRRPEPPAEFDPLKPEYGVLPEGGS